MAGQILLVEDDRDLGMTLRLFLELHGFDVQVVSDAESALTALEADPVDLVITDDQLPGMSGQGLAARVFRRSQPLPIIAFTGSDDTDQMESSGLFAGILRKPCEPLQLVELVRVVLDHSDARTRPPR